MHSADAIVGFGGSLQASPAWTDWPDLSIRYMVSGRGPHSLVLLHELGGGLESWDDVVPLIENDFRLLRYDQRGSGLSEKPRRAFTLDDHVGDLDRLIGAAGLPQPVHIAAVAAGAAIAVAFAAHRPRAVASLALCAPALMLDRERHAYLAERSIKAAGEGMRAIVDAALERSYPAATRREGAAYARYRARLLANDPLCYRHANMAVAGADLERLLDQIDIPCLVLAGVHDGLRPPEQVERAARKLRRSEFALLDSGHLMPVQAPRDLSARLRAFFLAQAACTAGAS